MRRLYQGLILAAYAAALVIPGAVFVSHRGGFGFLAGAHGATVLQFLFPLLGLYAFTFVTMQVLVATNIWWLRRLWPRITNFHRFQGTFALLFVILHPLFILTGFGLAQFLNFDFTSTNFVPYAILGETAFVILMATIGTAILVWRGRNIPWWFTLHKLNYLVFILVWLHSYLIGGDIRSSNLRYLWILYLVMVIVSFFGKYVIAPRWGRRT